MRRNRRRAEGAYTQDPLYCGRHRVHGRGRLGTELPSARARTALVGRVMNCAHTLASMLLTHLLLWHARNGLSWSG